MYIHSTVGIRVSVVVDVVENTKADDNTYHGTCVSVTMYLHSTVVLYVRVSCDDDRVGYCRNQHGFSGFVVFSLTSVDERLHKATARSLLSHVGVHVHGGRD